MPPQAADAIQAGQYVLVAHLWDEYTGVVPLVDQDGRKYSEQSVYARHVKGDVVTLDVENARRLLRAGAVLTVEDAAQQAKRAADRDAALRVLTGP